MAQVCPTFSLSGHGALQLSVLKPEPMTNPIILTLFFFSGADRMTPENQSKDKKHVRVHEHQPEEDAKSTGKRKRDHGELENEPQAKRLFLRKAAKPSGKIGNVPSDSHPFCQPGLYRMKGVNQTFRYQGWGDVKEPTACSNRTFWIGLCFLRGGDMWEHYSLLSVWKLY